MVFFHSITAIVLMFSQMANIKITHCAKIIALALFLFKKYIYIYIYFLVF